jgi:hypothetical protein
MSDLATETRLARVVHVVDPDSTYAPVEVVINRGAHNGVKLGDRFLVIGEGPHITDPETGEDLGQLELVRGRGEVVHVQDHMATIRSIERRRTRPAKRITREAFGGALSVGLGVPGRVIEEELAPEAEMPFEAVRLGDLAKPI